MKILYTTTVGSTMGFFKAFIKELISDGNKVDIATNECDGESVVPPCFREWGCKVYPIDTSRSPFNLGNIRAIKQIKDIVKKGDYDIVHCHTPFAAAATRLACKGFRKKGLMVFYTAHGFHFFKGAPIKNWLIYYPIEKFCAHFTDVLITINKEDYALALKKMPAKKICYVPGVGIDISKIHDVQCDRNEVRKSMGVPEDCILLLSVGELNANKNHQVVVKALAKLNNRNVHYAVAGEGNQKENLLSLAKKMGVENQFHLLGFRTDVPAIAKSSDIFCFPSHREGLGLAALEAMSCGLPLITSNVHGINDYSQDDVTGYKCSPNDENEWCEKINKMIVDSVKMRRFGECNKKNAENFSTQKILHYMRDIYNG